MKGVEERMREKEDRNYFKTETLNDPIEIKLIKFSFSEFYIYFIIIILRLLIETLMFVSIYYFFSFNFLVSVSL